MAEISNVLVPTSAELVITREFNAPRALVWRAWTEPELFKKWWGPKMFTCPVAKMDVRVGGKYLWSMRGEGWGDIYTTGEFLEVVPIEKLVYTDSFSDAAGNIVSPTYYKMPSDFPEKMLVTVRLEDLGNTTKMTIQHVGVPSGEMTDATKQGWNESFDKLGDSMI
ncbi:MAG: SRPBCC domain-containing protein [Candidatus Kapaibacterium sp.]|jgi:uncharacterized protein YndB with AHSA1/START domain